MRAHPGWAWFCIAVGLLPVGIAVGAIPVAEARVHAPMWVVALSGTVFVVGGCMLLLARRSRWNDGLAALICLAFAALGFWTAFVAPPGGFAGGLPLVSRDTNITVARWIFGGGAVCSLVLFGTALRRAVRRRGDARNVAAMRPPAS